MPDPFADTSGPDPDRIAQIAQQALSDHMAAREANDAQRIENVVQRATAGLEPAAQATMDAGSPDDDYITPVREEAAQNGDALGFLGTLPVLRTGKAIVSGVSEATKHAGALLGNVLGADEATTALDAEANQMAQDRLEQAGGPIESKVNRLAGDIAPWAIPIVGPALGGASAAEQERVSQREAGASGTQANLRATAIGLLSVALPHAAGEIVGPAADRLASYIGTKVGTGALGDAVTEGVRGAVKGTAAGASLPIGNAAVHLDNDPNHPFDQSLSDLASIPESAATLGVLGGLGAAAGGSARLRTGVSKVPRSTTENPSASSATVQEVHPDLADAQRIEQIVQQATETSHNEPIQPAAADTTPLDAGRPADAAGVETGAAPDAGVDQGVRAPAESASHPPADLTAAINDLVQEIRTEREARKAPPESPVTPDIRDSGIANGPDSVPETAPAEHQTSTEPAAPVDTAPARGQRVPAVPGQRLTNIESLRSRAEAQARGELDQPKPAAQEDTTRIERPAGAPKAETLPLRQINLSPDELQFRQGADENGVAKEPSKPLDWNSMKPLTVWKDAKGELGKPGKVYVVDGHHRHQLLREAAAKGDTRARDQVPVEYMQAENAREARNKAALSNIAKGNAKPEETKAVLKDETKRLENESTAPVDETKPANPETIQPKAGTVRMYHGESPEQSKERNSARFFSMDRKYAEGYAKKNGGDDGVVSYVDVPTDHPAIHDRLFHEDGTPTHSKSVNAELPADIAGKRQLVEQHSAETPSSITEQDRQEKIDLHADDLAATAEGKKLGPSQRRKQAAAHIDRQLAEKGVRVVGYGGTPSISEHLWGDKSFVKNDLKVTAESAAKGISEAADDIRRAFAPQTRGEQAKQMAGMAREHGATLARSSDIAEQALHTAKRLFDTQSKEENYAFIDRMERGEQQPSDALQTIADTMRHIMDTKRDEIRGLGKGKLAHFIEDYFPHLWKDPEQAINVFSQAAGRRPIEGRKSFLKKRSIPTFKEGVEAGLEPVSDNPVDLVILKAREMDKYLLGQRLLTEMKEKGLAKFVRATERAPEGFAKINDPIASVYGPPTVEVPEHVNRATYDALQEVADKLGVTHERKAKLGGSMLGYSLQGGDYIASKFATDLSVIAHEISHQLDHKFDLQTTFMKNPNVKIRVAMNKELRALADLHEYKKKYFRKAEEKMASLLEGYVSAPERFKEVAPTVWKELMKFMDDHSELHPLRDMKQSMAAKKLTAEIPHGGLLKYGEYYAPEAAASLINNYLSPGLRAKSGVFRAYLGAGNFLNQFQLGLSFFHLGFTSLDTAISKFALATKYLDAGHPIKALGHALQVPVAPFTTALSGLKMLREWYKPGSQGEEIGRIMDAYVAAGGRGRMDKFYQTTLAQNMMTAFRKGNLLGGLIRIPGSIIELTAKPIMEHIVPMQKMGVFADMARLELAKLPEGATRDQVRAAMGRAQDSVDNRLGQMVYDNLFWHKTIKDLSMASVRSLGWNLGTVREVAGGGFDTIKALGSAVRLRRPEFTHRMAYVVAMPLVTGMVGALWQYLKTGQGPQELTDYFFPKTGEKDENGKDIRLNMPSYMKDIYHYGHDPAGAVTGKLHPLITTIADMIRNKDFFDRPIRNADDPFMKQALDEAKFLGHQFEPMGIRNFTEDRNAGMSTGEKAAAFIGVTKAPKYLSQSTAEQMAGKLSQDSYHGEGMSEDTLQTRREILTKLRSTDEKDQQAAQDQLEKAVNAGTFTDRQANNLVRQSSLSRLEYQVLGLTANDAMRVWRVASPQEKRLIRDELEAKIDRSKTVDAEKKNELFDEIERTAP